MNTEFKIIEYKTASGATPQELDVSVMELLGVGYEPFGSPYLSDRQAESLGGNLTFYQAMVMSNKPRVTLREVAAQENLPSEVNVSVVTDETATADITR